MIRVSFISQNSTRHKTYKKNGIALKKAIFTFVNEHKLNSVIVFEPNTKPTTFNQDNIDLLDWYFYTRTSQIEQKSIKIFNGKYWQK